MKSFGGLVSFSCGYGNRHFVDICVRNSEATPDCNTKANAKRIFGLFYKKLAALGRKDSTITVYVRCLCSGQVICVTKRLYPNIVT